jgi:DNA-binding SARP family transcriptional activator
MLSINLLGPVEIIDDGIVRTPGAPKALQVLALLLFNANSTVSVSSLIEELWSTNPPASAVTTTQTYIYHLRRTFAAGGHRDLIATRPPGYLVRLAPEDLDAARFAALTRQAREELAAGRPARANELAEQALRLWRGPALLGVARGPLLEGHVARIEELRLSVLEIRVDAQMQLDQHRQLVGDLRTLIAEHPLHEWFHAQLMIALGRCGRRAEALDTYRRLRLMLAEELGLEPAASVQLIHRSLHAGTGAPGRHWAAGGGQSPAADLPVANPAALVKVGSNRSRADTSTLMQIRSIRTAPDGRPRLSPA